MDLKDSCGGNKICRQARLSPPTRVLGTSTRVGLSMVSGDAGWVWQRDG